MATINMHDAKTQLSDLVARAEAGEEIVIARRNKPAVRLVRVGAGSGEVGFGESEQAHFEANELAVEGGKGSIMQEGKPVAADKENAKRVRGFGLLAHLPAVPDEAFFDPLPEEELQAWEGDASPDEPARDRGKPGR